MSSYRMSMSTAAKMSLIDSAANDSVMTLEEKNLAGEGGEGGSCVLA